MIMPPCPVGAIDYLKIMSALIARIVLICLVLLLPIAVDAAGQPDAVERTNFVFHSDNPMYIDIADSILSTVRQQLTKILGDTLPYRPAVYILDNEAAFNRLVGGRFPDWGAAVAIPERRAMAVKSPGKFRLGKSLAELLAHEYAHLMVAHRTGFNRPPRWFDEGVAMLVSTEWSWSDNLAMSKAVVLGDLMTLKDIEQVNRFNRSKAQVAYAQSYLAVKFMLDQYGRNALKRFLDEMASGGTVDDALMASCGADHKDFEDEYHEFLIMHYNVATLFSETMYFWLALAVLLIIGATLRYRRRRQYYRKWEREERLHSTDFDYGDPDHPEQIDDDDEPWRS